jgi:flagellar basal body L-ring protein FlgH
MMKTISVLVLLLVLATAVTAYAHHSFAAEFDANKPVKITGAVTKVEWQNPHVWFYIDVKDASSGKIVNWGIELGSPNGLMRVGWDRKAMKTGDVVTVEGSRAKDESNNANARAVTLASTGKRLFAASSQGQQ